MYRSPTMHSEKNEPPTFPRRNSHEQRGHVSIAIPDAAFSAARFCSYIVRRTQYNRPS